MSKVIEFPQIQGNKRIYVKEFKTERVSERLAQFETIDAGIIKTVAAEFGITERRVRQIQQKTVDLTEYKKTKELLGEIFGKEDADVAKHGGQFLTLKGEEKPPMASKRRIISLYLLEAIQSGDEIDYEELAAEYGTSAEYVRKCAAPLLKQVDGKTLATASQKEQIVKALGYLGKTINEKKQLEALNRLTKKQASTVMFKLWKLLEVKRMYTNDFSRRVLKPLIESTDCSFISIPHPLEKKKDD
ncbi:hypothetical protein [Geotalea sp. SG265]|uniref:hypothetical protein n=1 Tax=Geotalea sp. SG265 TaxID=2922867 RepID=UPI001FAF99A2|nr:hypothetical protein [Geotalea sp. SG265]